MTASTSTSTSAPASSSTHILPGKRKVRGTDESSESAVRVSTIGVEKSGIGVGLRGGIGVGSGRVTRRSTAQAQQVTQDVESESQRFHVPERSRTEKEGVGEKNIANKRQKISLSPKYQRPQASSQPGAAGTSQPTAQASSSSPTKEVLPHTSIRRHLPYPIGLTPFRYPCHHPQQAAPPPGDPLDANWRPYDPYLPAHLEGLPPSVVALSVLERASRAGRVVGSGGKSMQVGPVRTLGNAGSIPTYQGGDDIRTIANPPITVAVGDLSIPIDPSLVSLPPPPMAMPTHATNNASGGIPGLAGMVQGQTGDGEFDFNSFFESATYETISALLSAGDNVGDNPGQGDSGHGGETGTASEA